MIRGVNMKLAIIGSRNLIVILANYISRDITEIVSGGAQGIDLRARQYAVLHGIKMVEFLPEYENYRRNAPLVRNKKIVDYADAVLAFWDGKSKGTQFTIAYAEKIRKPLNVIIIKS